MDRWNWRIHRLLWLSSKATRTRRILIADWLGISSAMARAVLWIGHNPPADVRVLPTATGVDLARNVVDVVPLEIASVVLAEAVGLYPGSSGTMPMSPNRFDGAGGGDAPGLPQTSDTGIVVGVDLGGTSLRVGVVDLDGHVLQTTIVPSSTGCRQRPIWRIWETSLNVWSARRGWTASAAWHWHRHERSGGYATGLIDNPHTLAAWSGVALRAPLMERFGLPVLIDNDAAAAGLGEYWHGAGVGACDWLW